MSTHILGLLMILRATILRTHQCISNGSRLDYLPGRQRIPDPRTAHLPMAAPASPAQESKGTRLPIAIQPNAKPNNTTSMHISEEWLTFEKEVLGKRPLFTGTVAECRSAYLETSDSLAPRYGKIVSAVERRRHRQRNGEAAGKGGEEERIFSSDVSGFVGAIEVI